MNRRSLLCRAGQSAAAASLLSLAGCSSLLESASPRGTATPTLTPAPVTSDSSPGDSPGTPTRSGRQTAYGDWLDSVDNYDGRPLVLTDFETVTIRVGAAGNGGHYAFDPPAVVVSPGTTVRWKWTGQGGAHNVVAENGAFDSDVAHEPGTTFQFTLTDPGVYRYRCEPHTALGMRGVVEVVD